jgi:hypothetical protein
VFAQRRKPGGRGSGVPGGVAVGNIDDRSRVSGRRRPRHEGAGRAGNGIVGALLRLRIASSSDRELLRV